MASFNSGLFNSGAWGSPGQFIVRIPQSKNSIVNYIRPYLNDIQKRAYSDAYLTQLVGQGEVDIVNTVSCVWDRFSVTVQSGNPFVDLPDITTNVTRVTYLNYKLDPVTQYELSRLSPVFTSQVSTPRWYSINYDGYRRLRLFPASTLSIAADDTQVYTTQGMYNLVIVSAFLNVKEDNTTISIPDYYSKIMLKFFVLMKCFAQEGVFQNIEISAYYAKRYTESLVRFKQMMTSVKGKHIKEYTDLAINTGFRRHRPIYPPNYGKVIPIG